MEELKRITLKLETLESENAKLRQQNANLEEKIKLLSSPKLTLDQMEEIERIEIKIATETLTARDISDLVDEDPCPFDYFHWITFLNLALQGAKKWEIRDALLKIRHKYTSVLRAFMAIEHYDVFCLAKISEQEILETLLYNDNCYALKNIAHRGFSKQTWHKIICAVLDARLYLGSGIAEIYDKYIKNTLFRNGENERQLLLDLATLYLPAIKHLNNFTKEEARYIAMPRQNVVSYKSQNYKEDILPEDFKAEPGSLEIIVNYQPSFIAGIRNKTLAMAVILLKRDKKLFVSLCPIKFAILIDNYINNTLPNNIAASLHQQLFDLQIINMVPEQGTCLSQEELDFFNKTFKTL